MFAMIAVSIFGLFARSVKFDELMELNKTQFWKYFTHLFYCRDVAHIFISALGVYCAGKILEQKMGSAVFALISLAGGLTGSLLQIVLFSGGGRYSVQGAEGAATAAFAAGIILSPNRAIRFFRKHTDRFIVSGFTIFLAWFTLLAVYNIFISTKGHSPGWGLMFGGLISGVALAGVMSIVNMNKETESENAASRQRASSDVPRQTTQRKRLTTTSFNALSDASLHFTVEEQSKQFAEHIEKGDYKSACGIAITLISSHLDNKESERAKEVFALVEHAFGELRAPSRQLIMLVNKSIEVGDMFLAKELTIRLIKSDNTASGLEDVLARLIEALLSKPDVEMHSIERFLNYYRLMGPNETKFRQLYGIYYSMKARLEKRIAYDESVIKAINNGFFTAAFDKLVENDFKLFVPPDRLLALANGLCVNGLYEDAVEVYSFMAHNHAKALETPEAIRQIINIYTRQIADTAKAERWFSYLETMYPETKATLEARRRLTSLNLKPPTS